MELVKGNRYMYHGHWVVRFERLYRRMYEFTREPDGGFIRVSWRNIESEIKPLLYGTIERK